jgi:hypothetical protein
MRTVQSSLTRANGGVANTRLAEPAEVACAIALSFRPIVCIQLCEHAAQEHGLASQIFIDLFFERFQHLCGRFRHLLFP